MPRSDAVIPAEPLLSGKFPVLAHAGSRHQIRHRTALCPEAGSGPSRPVHDAECCPGAADRAGPAALRAVASAARFGMRKTEMGTGESFRWRSVRESCVSQRAARAKRDLESRSKTRRIARETAWAEREFRTARLPRLRERTT